MTEPSAAQENHKIAQPLVSVESVSRYYGEHCAVDQLSFSVMRGQVLGFLGPNGAGKTTTMNMLTGNLAPSAGRITINGHDLLDDPRAAKAAIGYLPEQPPLYQELTVDEYLQSCARLNNIPRAQLTQAVAQAKEKCGLANIGHRLIANLSKGYKQRIGIAQAIIHMPPVVILDEPTVGLDPIQIHEIRLLIRELGKDHGVILSTHILPEIQATCDRVQIINKGRLVLHESIDGLARHMEADSLTVRYKSDIDVHAIETLPDITSVEVQEQHRYRIFHRHGAEPADNLVRLGVERGWQLVELRPGRISLEQIFMELTTEEHQENAT